MRWPLRDSLPIGCITRMLLGQILIDAGRRLVELVVLQDTASRRNNDVECIMTSFQNFVVLVECRV
jgi:hypothetical protein